MAVPAFPSPRRGASLMLAFRMQSKLTLVVGSGNLAASRALAAVEADSDVVVLCKGGPKSACEELRWRAGDGQLELLDLDELPGPSSSDDALEHDFLSINSFLDSRPQIALVCITDTLASLEASSRRSSASAAQLYRACHARNIPVNTADMPALCDFTFCASHRFYDSEAGSSRATPLQVGVTTNGHGCRLAGRIRREIVARLPPGVGQAVTNMGRLRALAKEVQVEAEIGIGGDGAELAVDEEGCDEATAATPNWPVPQHTVEAAAHETEVDRTRRRMKWVAQISEYWSFDQLAKLSETDMAGMLSDAHLARPTQPPNDSSGPTPTSSFTPSIHSLILSPPVPSQKPGRILLIGSGPGHPALLTLAAHHALTRDANLVLTDKLVPAGVLALIPSHVEVRVARKFPGNAERAQEEMMEAAVCAARAGKTVVRVRLALPLFYFVLTEYFCCCLAQARRPDALRPRGRGNSLLPQARLRMPRRPGNIVRARRAALRVDPGHAAGSRGRAYSLHRRWKGRAGRTAARIRAGAHARAAYGRRAAELYA